MSEDRGRVRPLAAADAADWDALCARAAPTPPPTGLPEALAPLELVPGDWVGAVEESGRLIAYAGLRPLGGPAECPIVVVAGAVDPEHRGQGWGTALLGRSLDAARALARRQGAGRVEVRCTRPDREGAPDEGRQGLLLDHGLDPWRGGARLSWDLDVARDAAEPDPPAAGHEVVLWAAEHDDALRRAHNDVFAEQGVDPWTADLWRRTVSGSQEFLPTATRLVLDDRGEVAAFLVALRRGSTAYVAMTGTRPSHRGRGLGALLLAHLRRDARAEGLSRVDLDVHTANEPAIALYRRAGFVEVRRHVIHQAVLRADPAPRP